jgi:hypothetical protein
MNRLVDDADGFVDFDVICNGQRGDPADIGVPGSARAPDMMSSKLGKYVARSLFSREPPALDRSDLVSSDAIRFRVAATLFPGALFVGTDNSKTGLGCRPLGILGSASSDALNLRLRRRLAWPGDLGSASPAEAAPPAGFRRSDGHFWRPVSALLTRVDVRRAVTGAAPLVA